MSNAELSLYFHVPYCKQKCFYCDFNSYPNKISTADLYFESMQKEIMLYKEFHNAKINTIFIGGGTPSYVNTKYIENILNACGKYFRLSEDIEITIESNPDSLNYEKLLEYKKIGINRLSIGMQAWQDFLLEKIGRVHSNMQFQNAFNHAVSAGFDNINIDLMFSLPSQTFKNWEETLQRVVELTPQHISCYSLILEPDTKLSEEFEKGTLDIPDEDIDRDMYNKALTYLKDSGYEQYEISNFSLKGYECRHNLTYWTFKEYIGFGAGAHSFFNNTRTENFESIEDYIQAINKLNSRYKAETQLDEKDQISEYIITGLRLTKGIDKRDFCKHFNKSIEQFYNSKIKEYINIGLIIDDKNTIKLSQKGFDLSNTILCEFV